ncbi:MAG: hypothetical protein MI922_00425, partial [Bacteroidales bacterium]|nr:hypothetical protein [Bacteroidales bacterium]
LVENAIVHGVSNLQREKKVTLKITGCNEKLYIDVSDNGNGLNNKKDSLSENGFGLKLVKERLSLLSLGEKVCTLKLHNFGPGGIGQGTTVNIEIPI